jgi:hypothetical protein
MPNTTTPPQPIALPTKPAQQAAASTKSAEALKVVPAGEKKLSGKKSFGRKHPGVLFITRQQLFIYIEGTTNVVTYLFTPDVVRDLDVINQDILHEKIAGLITQQQLPPASFYVILSNQTLFSKQVMATDVSQKKVDEEKFLSTIPFETPSVRDIAMGSNTYTVVANEQLFSAFSAVFAKEGSEFLLVLPEFLFSKELNLTQGLTVQSAQTLLKKAQEFKAYSFIRKDLPDEGPSVNGQTDNKKFKLQVSGGKSNRLFIIVGVLVMLIGVFLAAFLLFQQSREVEPPPAAVLEEPTPIPSPEIPEEFQIVNPATSGAELATPSADVEGDTSSDITIQFTDGNAYTAELIADRLRLLGFQTITMKRISEAGSAPQITFRPTVSEAVEKLIVDELGKQYGELVLRQSNSVQNDIVISLGNNTDD